jgi:hypothetical protein
MMFCVNFMKTPVIVARNIIGTPILAIWYLRGLNICAGAIAAKTDVAIALMALTLMHYNPYEYLP